MNSTPSSRGARAADDFVFGAAEPKSEAVELETNGSNCTLLQAACPYRKVGVLRMLRDARNRVGRPIPLFVNLYVVSNPKRARRRPGDRLKVLPHARMKVDRYKPSLRG